MIIVTGATGQLGRLIVDQLVARVPASRVAVSVRKPEEASDHQARGVRVRRGDFDDPQSLAHAFEAATQVLIVSSNASAYGGDPIAQHRNAIDAARTAGAERIVYTSHMAASVASAFPPMRDHAATEDSLRSSGLAWTSLRNGFYASSGLFLVGDAPSSGVIEAPADGPVAWTAHADLAEAAAIVLAGSERHDGPTPPLTGAQALDLAQLAALASALVRRPVRRETIADEDLRRRLAARGAPDAVAKISLGLFAASRAGEFAKTDPTLERWLGRPPIDMRAVMAEKIGVGA